MVYGKQGPGPDFFTQKVNVLLMPKLYCQLIRDHRKTCFSTKSTLKYVVRRNHSSAIRSKEKLAGSPLHFPHLCAHFFREFPFSGNRDFPAHLESREFPFVCFSFFS